jgi:hypothetical protein
MSNNNSVPGMMLPTQKGMLSGNPRDSAMQSMNNNSQLQAQATTALAGGRHRKRKVYGGGDAIAVPQYQMHYDPQGGNGTNPNNIIAKSAQTSTQGAANAALDAGATTMGGSRRRRSRKGGNPDWLWGCMSGGKKRTSKAKRKARRTLGAYGKAGNKRRTSKSRKSRRSRKH